MTVLLPRLDRETTSSLIDDARGKTVAEVASRIPAREVRTRSTAQGGLEIADAELAALRHAVVELARGHGYPEEVKNLPLFDALCARIVHASLPISPHEASEDDIWSYLTCVWLLDVAAWRWGGVGDSERRFRGDVNRNTFRRLWWRAEVLGSEIDLAQLGEDELVNIMERPTIAADRRLARRLAVQFLDRVSERDPAGRMMLMREAGKRLVRLTPIIDFHVMSDGELRALVDSVLTAAAKGGNVAMTSSPADIEPSGVVERIGRLAPVHDEAPIESPGYSDLGARKEYGEVALAIAKRTGRVTNSALREVIALEPADARKVLQDLVEDGVLARRGKAKGTYYVLPGSDGTDSEPEAVQPVASMSASHASPEPDSSGAATQEPSHGEAEKTLRRFLKRRG